jgi:hypothetical protein
MPADAYGDSALVFNLDLVRQPPSEVLAERRINTTLRLPTESAQPNDVFSFADRFE